MLFKQCLLDRIKNEINKNSKMTISICLYKKHDAHGNNNHDDFIEKFY